MALVNVAVELVKAGRKVLIVDFDLEAPGLDTFNLPRPSGPTKGLVDAVIQYTITEQSPNIDEFIYKSPIPNVPGELWVMPAGEAGDRYDRNFKSINWRDLYENKNGYLLFEDIKEQWKQLLDPDYVLIDSRTGHTDVSGICTRQLPDSVLLFIFPTEQNRRGLETVVRQIRGEAETERKKDIKLQLVLSNLPEMDDEDGYLTRSLEKIKETLGFDPAAVIHHYPSLALLAQTIFTLDRPKTKLALEYKAITKLVQDDNLEDREVALEFLEKVSTRNLSRHLFAKELDDRLGIILEKHGNDAEILTRLAIFYRKLRRFDEALTLLEKGESLKVSGGEFYLNKAELYIIKNQLEAAFQDVQKLLSLSDVTYLEVSAAARILQQRFPDSLPKLIESPAFAILEPYGKYLVSNELLETRPGLEVALTILAEIEKTPDLSAPLDLIVPSQMSLAHIGLGHFSEAIEVIRRNKEASEIVNLNNAFNLAMAKWGLEGFPSKDLFQKVIELEKITPNESTNGHQCLSLAFWVVGEVEKARARFQEAWQKMVTQPSREFSAWSYLELPRDEFIKDLDEMRLFFDGEKIAPRFIRENLLTKEVPYNA